MVRRGLTLIEALVLFVLFVVIVLILIVFLQPKKAAGAEPPPPVVKSKLDKLLKEIELHQKQFQETIKRMRARRAKAGFTSNDYFVIRTNVRSLKYAEQLLKVADKVGPPRGTKHRILIDVQVGDIESNVTVLQAGKTRSHHRIWIYGREEEIEDLLRAVLEELKKCDDLPIV